MNVRHDPSFDLGSPLLQPGMAASVQAYLDWVERQDGKYEYDRGTIGMMVKVTQNHAVLGSRFVFLLMQRLEGLDVQVVAEAFAVRVGKSVRFPDVLVQRAGQKGSSLESVEPLVIVEVLSPSSIYADHVVKREEYLSLPTLQAYVVAESDSAKLTLWAWDAATGKFPDSPLTIEGVEAELDLRGLGVRLPLAQLYSGIV